MPQCGDCYEISYDGIGKSVYWDGYWDGIPVEARGGHAKIDGYPVGARAGSAKIQVINSGAGGTKHFDCLDGAFNQITGLHTDGMPITYKKITCP